MAAKTLTVQEFVIRGIHKLRKPDHHGIHTVYSGFNAAFRAYFPNLDPVAEIRKLVGAGIIGCKPARGGAKIWDAKELAEAREAERKRRLNPAARAALSKMGLQ